jgi:hypothetical protein
MVSYDDCLMNIRFMLCYQFSVWVRTYPRML